MPPSDSLYYSHESFSSIQEKILTSYPCQECFLTGDMNTRFGSFVRDLMRFPGLRDHEFSYPCIPDDVMFPNDNAFILSGICKETKLVYNINTLVRIYLRTYVCVTLWVPTMSDQHLP